jgi:flagellar hook-length control protein FliK
VSVFSEAASAAAPAQQASPAAAASPAPTGASIDMQSTIDTVRATIAIATREGMAQARIALQPRELGDIRIHLSQTADGLLARLTADTPASAQALADAHAELHHSLSSLGVSLLRLDIGGFSHSGPGDREAGLSAERGRGGVPTETTSSHDDETTGAADVAPAPPTVGERLVDVLA